MTPRLTILLIRFAASPVAFLAALLLLPLLGIALFQDWAGALLGLLAPLLHLAGALLLRRSRPALDQALRQALEQRGAELCEAGPEDARFLLVEPEGCVRVFLAGSTAASLRASVLVVKGSWLALARLQGGLFPPRRWRPLEFDIRDQAGLEVYLREVSHLETESGKITLHTSGGGRIDLPDGRGEHGRASDFLKKRLRSLGNS